MNKEDPDESDAVAKIDNQLQELGWVEIESIDSDKDGYIKEYVLEDGRRADYALVINNEIVGFIEAKREQIQPEYKLQQPQTYAEIYGDEYDNNFGVPIVFTSNSDTHYIKDLRKNGRKPREIHHLYSPEDMKNILNKTNLTANLKEFCNLKPEDIDPNLWENQKDAVSSLQEAIQRRDNKMLLEMAPGTGKTRIAMAFARGLLQTNLSQSILFLTDREAIQISSKQDFKDYDATKSKRLGDMYNIGGIDPYIDNPFSTKIVIENIQTLRNRYENDIINQTSFDHIIVDESHRELGMEDERPQTEAIDYFDAVEIGITATPIQSTVERYNNNIVKKYTYEQGVNDGILAPFVPYQIQTKLTMEGVEIEDEETGMLEHYPPSKIGSKVFIPETNRVISEALVEREEIDLKNELTLVFTQNTKHAEKVKQTFEEVFKEKLDVPSNFVQTWHSKNQASGDVLDKFKDREKNPKVLIVVGKGKAGVDIPYLKNLVFMRAVKTKSTYNQMAGRGTRSPEEFEGNFRIYDCLGLFDYYKDSPLTGTTKDVKTTKQKHDAGHHVTECESPVEIYKDDELIKSEESYPAPKEHDKKYLTHQEYKESLQNNLRKTQYELKSKLININTIDQFNTIVKEHLNQIDNNYKEPFISQMIPQDETLIEFVYNTLQPERKIEDIYTYKINYIQNQYNTSEKQDEWFKRFKNYIVTKEKPILSKTDLTNRYFAKLGGTTQAKEEFENIGGLQTILNQINNKILELE